MSKVMRPFFLTNRKKKTTNNWQRTAITCFFSSFVEIHSEISENLKMSEKIRLG